MRTVFVVIGLVASVVACTAAPSVSGVEPSHGDCAADQALRIRGSALGPDVQVDLSSGDLGRVVAAVGGVGLRDITIRGGAVLEGTLPGGQLTAGSDYDVLVRTASGAESVLEGAFHCDGTPPVDGGDDGEVEEDDAGADEAEAEATGPLGATVAVSDSANARRGCTASVAWVADRWVVAWVDDDGAMGVLRLAEIPPGATEVAAVTDVSGAGRPTDPLVRAWAGIVWLSWVDLSASPSRYMVRLFDDGLGVRAAGGPLGSADDDVLWRRDHDVVRNPDNGQFAFFAPILGELTYSLLDPDGSVPLRGVAVGSSDAAPGEPRAVWAGGAYRVAWWETTTPASKCRAAVVAADGTVSAGPLDLALEGSVTGPVLWADDRSGAERLFACWENVADPMVRGIRTGTFDLDFGTPAAELELAGTGRAVRCAVRDGLVAWSVLSLLSNFSLGRVEPDGSVTPIADRLGRAVRAWPGVDIAAGPDRYGLVWIEDLAPGEPVAVRFAEVLPEP